MASKVVMLLQSTQGGWMGKIKPGTYTCQSHPLAAKDVINHRERLAG